MATDTTITPDSNSPSSLRYILSFLLVGLAWGFTVPFMRRAAVHRPPLPPLSPKSSSSWLRRQLVTGWYTVLGLLKTPSYAVPLAVNLSGGVWFFLLVGQHELSLTVPIINSMAFLFTVLGEYMAEGKLISKNTWVGMGLVCAGIALCVYSKI